MKIETIAVHGGYTPDPTTKAVAVPIYQTVAYAFDNTQHGADPHDPAAFAPLIDARTKAVFCESVGIEHIDDLLADLEQALAAV